MPTGRKRSLAILHGFAKQSHREQHPGRGHVTLSGARAGGSCPSSAVRPLARVACQMATLPRKPAAVGVEAACLAWWQVCSVRLSYHPGKRGGLFAFTLTQGSHTHGHGSASRGDKEMQRLPTRVVIALWLGSRSFSYTLSLSPPIDHQTLTPEQRASFVCRWWGECRGVLPKLF